MKPKISAVITTFNRCSIVPDAIKSVAAQTVQVHEIIVIDDGSSDETHETVFEAFKDISIPCRYVRKDNGGMASSLNTGIQEAVGDWIAFLDDDDLWHVEHIERCLEIAAQFPELGCISGIRDENGKTQSIPPDLLKAYDPSETNSTLTIKKRSPLISPFFTPVVGTTLIKKCLFEEIKFEPQAGARLDIYFFWRLSEITSIGLDLRSHGIGRQFRTSFLSTDQDAPQSIKNEVALRRSHDEIKMLQLLLSQLTANQSPVFNRMYKSSLIGRTYLLRNMGRYSEGLSWLGSCWRDCEIKLVTKEAILCLFKIKSA